MSPYAALVLYLPRMVLPHLPAIWLPGLRSFICQVCWNACKQEPGGDRKTSWEFMGTIGRGKGLKVGAGMNNLESEDRVLGAGEWQGMWGRVWGAAGWLPLSDWVGWAGKGGGRRRKRPCHWSFHQRAVFQLCSVELRVKRRGLVSVRFLSWGFIIGCDQVEQKEVLAPEPGGRTGENLDSQKQQNARGKTAGSSTGHIKG